MIPGTYVRPHRHHTPLKNETMVIIQGKMVALIFNPEGQIIEKIVLSPQGPHVAVDFDPGVWHSVYAIEPCIFFECKQGPCIPISDKDFASWAPAEKAPEAQMYLSKLTQF